VNTRVYTAHILYIGYTHAHAVHTKSHNNTCDHRNTCTQVYVRNTAYIAYVDRTYIHTATDKQTYKLIYTDLHSYCTYVHIYIQIHIRTCMHARARAHTHTHTHAYLYVRTYIQISHGDDFWDIAPRSQKLSDV
jgi:hypothetical protein